MGRRVSNGLTTPSRMLGKWVSGRKPTASPYSTISLTAPNSQALRPECPSKLDCDQLAVRNQTQLLRAKGQVAPSTVPHDEKIIARLHGPAHSRVAADRLRNGVVLNE